MIEDETFRIITMPVIGKWVKIGEVRRTGQFLIRGLYARFAVMERIDKDGMREYKEIYMASDDAETPVLKSQSDELELKK